MSFEFSYAAKQAVLQDVIYQQEEYIKTVQRKRWRESEKAIAIAGYKRRIDAITQIIEDLHRLEGLDK